MLSGGSYQSWHTAIYRACLRLWVQSLYQHLHLLRYSLRPLHLEWTSWQLLESLIQDVVSGGMPRRHTPHYFDMAIHIAKQRNSMKGRQNNHVRMCV